MATTTAKIDGDSSGLVDALDKSARAMGGLKNDARKLSDQLREVADDADKTAGALVQKIGGPGAIKAIAGVGAAFGAAKAGVELFLDSSEALFRSYGEEGQKVWDEVEKSLFAIKGAFAEAVLGGGSMEEMGARLKILFDGFKSVLDVLLTPLRLFTEGIWKAVDGTKALGDAEKRIIDAQATYQKAMADNAVGIREQDKAYQDLLKTLGDVVRSKAQESELDYERLLGEIDVAFERNREAREYRANAAADLAEAKAVELEVQRGIESKLVQARRDVNDPNASRRVAMMDVRERARELLEADQAFQAQLRVTRNAAREEALKSGAEATAEEIQREQELLTYRENLVQKKAELDFFLSNPPKAPKASSGPADDKGEKREATALELALARLEIEKRVGAAIVEARAEAGAKAALLQDDAHTRELEHMREHEKRIAEIKAGRASEEEAARKAEFDAWVSQNAKQIGVAIGSGKKLADIARASIGNVVSALGDKALAEAGLLYAAGDIPSAAAMVAAGVAAYATAGVLGATSKKAAAATPATAAAAPVPQNISYNLRVDAAFADGELVARQFARMQREAGRRGFVTAGAY